MAKVNMPDMVYRTCACGCGEEFASPMHNKIFINDAHRQAHHRAKMWARRHAWKYIDTMYDNEPNSTEHFPSVFRHYYNLALERRSERYELAHNVGSRVR